MGFQQLDRQNGQNLNNDTFYKMPVTSAQCIIGAEKYPEIGISLIYNDDNYSQGYVKTKKLFQALTKDNILQLYVSEDDFRSSNHRDNIG